MWWGKSDYEEFKRIGCVIARGEVNTLAAASLERRGSDSDSSADSDQSAPSVPMSPTGGKWWCEFGHSARGLEHLFGNNSLGLKRQAHVHAVISTVLKEQRKGADERRLARLSEGLTKASRVSAKLAGSDDAAAARSILLPDKQGSPELQPKRNVMGFSTIESLPSMTVSVVESDAASSPPIMKTAAAGFGQDDGAKLAIRVSTGGRDAHVAS